MASCLGPWMLQFGLVPSYWMEGCVPVIWLLHLKQTHSACHSRVVWSMFGAQSMWRLGSSLHDESSSGWVGSIRTKRGQHSGMMSGGGFGGLSLGLSSSSGISGTGHSTLAARRVCSSWGLVSGDHGARQVGHVGHDLRVMRWRRQPRWIGCWQLGHW